MSLKVFHIFFIAISTLTAFGFGAWGVYQFFVDEGAAFLVMGLGSVVAGIGLIIYGINFLNKFKHVRNL